MNSERRYDIDWIRVIVFDILILFHVGSFFSPWDWHIKNNVIADWLFHPMSFISNWRIAILFVISGMGTRFALSTRTGKSYINERFNRLFLPLIAGMLIVVPPQVYLERLTQGLPYKHFFDFYPHYFEGIYPKGNLSWHHLWFLPYLLLMSIAATPLFLYIRKGNSALIKKIENLIIKHPFALYIFIIPLLAVELIFTDKSISHALWGDWYALALYFVFFILGYLLICIKSSFWRAVSRTRYPTLIIGVLAYIFLSKFEINYFLYSTIKILNTWSWILTVFGFAAKYLNRESNLIKYRNRAVYPFYILHQTITITAGYFLIDSGMHYSLKMLILVVVTFGGSWLLYELIILRVPVIQPLFGVKRVKTIAGKNKA